MISYLIKMILCSGLFMGLYRLLLEKEKMHRFNRFYLLGTLLLSFLVPLISWHQDVSALQPIETFIHPVAPAGAASPAALPTGGSQSGYLPLLLLITYSLITGLLLFRFLRNLLTLLLTAHRNPRVKVGRSQLVLLPQETTPHSFLRYIFISARDYENGVIEDDVLQHEGAHVRQLHSLDVLFVEMAGLLCWFNPFVYSYRNSLQLNHEFLADEAVLKNQADIRGYQLLLLRMAAATTGSRLSHSFTYSITKKRLVMMTKEKSLFRAAWKQALVIPVLAISILLFSNRMLAQETGQGVLPKNREMPSTKEGLSPEQLQEYKAIVQKTENENGIPVTSKLTEAEKAKLQSLFLLMSKEQQEKQVLCFMPAPPPLPKNVPTRAQLEAWQNAAVYGVWINDKRVSNAILEKYISTDFSQFFVSKLSKNAINYGKHYYQVNLMTNDYFTLYLKKELESKIAYNMFIRLRHKS